jgi:hypothetical protein
LVPPWPRVPPSSCMAAPLWAAPPPTAPACELSEQVCEGCWPAMQPGRSRWSSSPAEAAAKVFRRAACAMPDAPQPAAAGASWPGAAAGAMGCSIGRSSSSSSRPGGRSSRHHHGGVWCPQQLLWVGVLWRGAGFSCEERGRIRVVLHC